MAASPPLWLTGTKVTAQGVLLYAELTVSSLDGDVICLNCVDCVCYQALVLKELRQGKTKADETLTLKHPGMLGQVTSVLCAILSSM